MAAAVARKGLQRPGVESPGGFLTCPAVARAGSGRPSLGPGTAGRGLHHCRSDGPVAPVRCGLRQWVLDFTWKHSEIGLREKRACFVFPRKLLILRLRPWWSGRAGSSQIPT